MDIRADSPDRIDWRALRAMIEALAFRDQGQGQHRQHGDRARPVDQGARPTADAGSALPAVYK